MVVYRLFTHYDDFYEKRSANYKKKGRHDRDDWFAGPVTIVLLKK